MPPATVLLVEDDPDRVQLTRHALDANPLDLEVEVARDGDQALDHLRERTDQRSLPDLILLDIKLPGTDGFTVLEEIRSTPATRYIPVVVLTSSREEEDRRQVYELGANSFISRPVDFNDLRDQLATIGTYWLDINEVPEPETPR